MLRKMMLSCLVYHRKYEKKKLKTYSFSNHLIFIWKKKNKWIEFKETCKNKLWTSNLFFFSSFFIFFYFFSLFSFPHIFTQIFQEPNIGALFIEMLYLLLVLALFGSSSSQFSKFFLWICNLNWPWSFKYHLLPIHSPPASCLKKGKNDSWACC